MNPGEPKWTQVNLSEPKLDPGLTCVNPSEPEWPQGEPEGWMYKLLFLIHHNQI